MRIATLPYPDMIVRTDSDAFGALPEGVKTLLPAGGIWDQALEDRLMRRRGGAPFAVAELDEHRAASEIDLSILQTVLFVRERTHQGVTEALRSGRMYARWTPDRQPPLRLMSWEIGTPHGENAQSGGDLTATGQVTVRLAVAGGNGTSVTARLIRRGAVIWSARLSPPFEEVIQDDPGGPSFYRLDVEGAYPYRLISNPIFVTPPAGRGDKA